MPQHSILVADNEENQAESCRKRSEATWPIQVGIMKDIGIHKYDNIDRAKVNIMLKALIDHGSRVLGKNPWDIDTQKHGVLLRGEWDEGASVLSITITDSNWYVPLETIWENIDSLMQAVHKQD